MSRGCIGSLIFTIFGLAITPVRSQDEPPDLTDQWEAAKTTLANSEANADNAEPIFYIRQIRVRGANQLSSSEIEKAIYPNLGPGRKLADIESARSALEKAHHEKGFQTVGVDIPQQNGTRGIIYLDVVENEVGRLRVRGAKFFLPSEIKRAAPSLAEGSVPNFQQVQEDIVNLNTWADRKVTPSLRPGASEGTVDVDLEVEDSLPLHGSIELNNRYSPDTTALRVNGSISYGNLWQRGHSIGFSTQLAPERIEDAEIYSGFYIARFAHLPSFSLMAMGTKQNSDVSTLGGVAVAGRGQTMGIRGMWSLPARGIYFHTLSAGFDYKSFDEDVTIGDESFTTPIDYYPFTVAYGGGWSAENHFTELNGSVSFNHRGTGSRPETFDAKRYLADGGFFYFRGDLSHTHDLPHDFQVFGKAQGQASNDPLINSEQYSGGGVSTVRGYLESEALGDSGWFLTAELRSPSLIPSSVEDEAGNPKNEWRFYGFWDGGRLYQNEALPEQTDLFELSSVGVGSHLRLWNLLDGYVDVAWPLFDQSVTKAYDPFWSFRVKAEF
ncbi:MAG: ShlB/FhaC/HecB family hemolysin secretion/activation protein [Verrucomicrobiae bacterium]|nr:ShlB/FhaC/HecB family hemolysin secretion/activation protein [Verrucomicrobiae bacterium]